MFRAPYKSLTANQMDIQEAVFFFENLKLLLKTGVYINYCKKA
jgi:hypothetical protein